MPLITLPDGNTLDFPNKVTGLEVAEKISNSLSKQASVISVNDELKDLSHVIDKDCTIKIFTSKDKEGLETIRHDTAHITAMAVQELFPGTQVTIGPIIENGFYYDFSRKEAFTEEDLKKIEVGGMQYRTVMRTIFQSSTLLLRPSSVFNGKNW